MKSFLSIILLFVFFTGNSHAKWTVLDSTTTALNFDKGFVDGIAFDNLGGYIFRGFCSDDNNYRIYKSLDRGFTWENIIEIYVGPDTINNQYYANAISTLFADKCLTNNNLYIIFNTADENINSHSGKFYYYKINDSTLTKNAAIMKVDRNTSNYEMIDTKICDRIKGLNMIDDKFGIVLGHQSIYKTEDGCRTFKKIFCTDTIAKWYFKDCSSPTKEDYYVLFTNDQYQCKLLYTNNAGSTWNYNSIPDTISNIKSIGPGKVFLVNPLKNHNKLLYSEDNFDTYVSALDTAVRRSDWTGNLYIKDNVYYIFNCITSNGFISFNRGKSWFGTDSINNIGTHALLVLVDGAIVDDSTIVIINRNGDRLFIYEKNKPVTVKDLTDIENAISISPNPAGDYIEISSTSNKNGLGGASNDITIYNTLGERVLTTPSKEGNIRIDISTLPRGIYFVKAGGETAKFVKM